MLSHLDDKLDGYWNYLVYHYTYYIKLKRDAAQLKGPELHFPNASLLMTRHGFINMTSKLSNNILVVNSAPKISQKKNSLKALKANTAESYNKGVENTVNLSGQKW